MRLAHDHMTTWRQEGPVRAMGAKGRCPVLAKLEPLPCRALCALGPALWPICAKVALSMNLSFLRLGWRTLWRDLRAGELRLLMLAVTLAVAALTSVGFFADRLQGGLQRDALQLLGGDAVVVSDVPTPTAFAAQAQALGLQAVDTVSFPTMGRASDAQGGGAKLVALKSVPPGYPLRGSLQVADATGAAPYKTRDIPARSEVWVDAPLLEALGLQIGDMLLLGDTQLRITRTIAVEPDRGAGFMGFAPRAMVNAGDLPATGLVQPASRLSYRFAVAGPERAVRQFSAWAAQEIDKPGVHGLRLESLESGRPEMQQTLERAQNFSTWRPCWPRCWPLWP